MYSSVEYLWECADFSTGIAETLHDEISPLGLRSICVDFGYFRTSFLQADQRAPKVARIADYQEVNEAVESALQGKFNFLSNTNPTVLITLPI